MKGDEIEAELRRLRQQVTGTAATTENRTEVRRQVEELMQQSPLPRVTSLAAEILHELEVVMTLPVKPAAPRCELLRRELERLGGHTATQIRGAVQASGFRSDESLSLQEARELNTILWPRLRRLREKFENEALPRDRVRNACRDLEELHEALPVDLSKLRERVAEVIEDLRQRLTSSAAEEQLDKLLEKLSGLATSQRDWEQLDTEKIRLEENAWAQDHPDDTRVVEARRLLASLEDLRQADAQLVALPSRIAPHLERGEYLAVFDQLRRSFDEADRRSLRHREPLEQSTLLLVERLDQAYSATAESDDPGDTEGQRRSLEELERLRAWLHDLPDPLRSLAADLEARVEALADRRVESWQEAALEEAREQVTRLPESQLAAYLDTLDPASPPAVRDWAQQTQRLLTDLEKGRQVELDMDEERLRRLEQATLEHGQGPATEEAARLAQDYREALEALEEIEAEARSTSVAVDELLRRLEPIARRFPRWRRVASVQARVRDAKLFHKLLAKAERGSRRDVQEARTLAAKISDASIRQRMDEALADLEEAVGKWDRIEKALDKLQDEKRLDRRAATITAAIQDADSFVRMAEKGAPAVEEHFPRRWHEIEGWIKSFLLEEIPGRIQTWAENAVADADSSRRLGQWRERFEEWLTVLQDPILREEGQELFDRRETELELDALVAAHHFDAALALLKEKQRLFNRRKHRELTAQLERSRAISAFRQGEDPQLERSLEVASRHGLDTELAEVFVAHFRKTGAGNALAELVRLRIDGLADHPQAARLAEWCLRLQREELDGLADELSGGENLTAVRDFFEALSRGEQPSQSLYLLFQVERKAIHWDPETREVAQTSFADLQEKVRGDLDDHAAALERWSATLKGDEPITASDLTDQELRDLLEETHAEVVSLIKRASKEIEEWLEPLTRTRDWVEPTGIYPGLGALLDEARQLVHQLRSNRDVLGEVWRVREDLLHGRGEHGHLGQLLTRLTVSALGRVLDVFKLVGHYFRDYAAITQIVEELLDLYRAGGEGMTSDELAGKDKALRRTYGYDFSPAQDRFLLLRRLDRSTYSEFLARLETMVTEVEAISAYESAGKQAVQGIGDQLKLRLDRLGQTGRPKLEIDTDRDAIAKLLSESTSADSTVEVLFKAMPQAITSTAAKRRLELVESSEWHQLLRQAMLAVQE